MPPPSSSTSSSPATASAITSESIDPFSVERSSSEILGRYFVNKLDKFNTDSYSTNDQLDMKKLSEEEILARIDKIDKETVGRIKMDELFEQSPTWAKDILKYLQDTQKGGEIPAVASEEYQQKKKASRGAPAERDLSSMRVVFDYLVEVGLMEKLKHNEPQLNDGDLHATAVMFMVEKAGSSVVYNNKEVTKLRVITDARMANIKTDMQATYDMFTLDALLQTVSNVFHSANKSQEKKFYCINADFRHYFHQIRLPLHLRNLFKVKCGSYYYRMVVLPMGWYLSPSFAQTCSWSFLLGRRGCNTQEKIPFVDDRNISQMPQWIPFTKGVGGIFVLQDNIFIVTEHQEIAEAWKKRMNSRAKEGVFNFEFKEKFDSKEVKIEVISAENEPTEFTGIAFGYGKWRTVSKQVRSDPFEVSNSNKNSTSSSPSFTHRQIAGMLGEILWSHRVRRIKSLYNTDLMNIFGANTPPSREHWDKINPSLSQDQLTLLKEELHAARAHPSCTALPFYRPDSSSLLQYAVDASMEQKREFVTLSKAQIAICLRRGNNRWTWKNKIQLFSYIGEAELEAIVWCVRDAVAHSKGEVTTIVIATDSLCAKGWVERMYSNRPLASELLKELDDYLSGRRTGKAIRVVCVYIRTDNNIADVPSRCKMVSSSWKEITEGNNANWGDTDGSDINKRQEASSRLLKVMTGVVERESVTQGRQAVRTQRHETQMKVAVEVNSEKGSEM